jgi:hypothetical protein
MLMNSENNLLVPQLSEFEQIYREMRLLNRSGTPDSFLISVGYAIKDAKERARSTGEEDPFSVRFLSNEADLAIQDGSGLGRVILPNAC